MINKKYLDQALRIRKDFKTTDEELIGLKDELLKVNNDIKSTLDKLVELKDKSEEYTDEETFLSDVKVYLTEFETQANNVNKIYIPLNDSMEKLKLEEEQLFEMLVKEYPHLKVENIVKEVQDYLRDNIDFT
tara:strand:+ start:32044 stop:32439 length:396 start_codon:yes stop_codon:yes gene_type:complete